MLLLKTWRTSLRVAMPIHLLRRSNSRSSSLGVTSYFLNCLRSNAHTNRWPAICPRLFFSREPMLPVRAELPQAPAEPPGKSKFTKTEEIELIPRYRTSRLPDNLFEASAAERWIPPVLLAAWRRGDRLHKLVLASIGAACLGIFALILTLAVAHIGSPVESVRRERIFTAVRGASCRHQRQCWLFADWSVSIAFVAARGCSTAISSPAEVPACKSCRQCFWTQT